MAIQSHWRVGTTTYFSSLGFVCLRRMQFAIPLITIGCKSLRRVCRKPQILPINVRLHLLMSKYVMWTFLSQLKGKIAPIHSFIFLLLQQSKHSFIGSSNQGLLTNVPFAGIWIHPVFGGVHVAHFQVFCVAFLALIVFILCLAPNIARISDLSIVGCSVDFLDRLLTNT